MQTRSPFFEEIAKSMETAIGLAQAAGEEAKAALRAQGDRLAAEFDLVRRDELEAVRDALNAEIAALRAELGRLQGSASQATPDSAVRPPHDPG
jgi:BMFP domain-containing protein YqiC